MYAKRSLGQNFLANDGILKKITIAGNIAKGEVVFEVGPGHGALTKHLLATGAQVHAIEKDTALVEELKQTFTKEIASGAFHLYHGDALTFETKKLPKKPFKVIANIPYNITGAFFRKYLSAKTQPSLMIILIQEEVADRITKKDKKGNLLSLAIQAYGVPKKLFKVSRGSFRPAPRVDSAVISISDISRAHFAKNNEELFFELLRAGFAHKRKKLFSNLSSVVAKEKLHTAFIEQNLSIDVRAESLTLSQWLTLSHSLSTQ